MEEVFPQVRHTLTGQVVIAMFPGGRLPDYVALGLEGGHDTEHLQVAQPLLKARVQLGPRSRVHLGHIDAILKRSSERDLRSGKCIDIPATTKEQ